MSAERLQKVLASAGIASRRDCEELISAGRVSVNGKIVRVAGTRVDPAQDEIVVDGRPIGQISPRTYVMLNKPTGVVSTADDPQGRPTVVELVDLPARLFPVGRLDYDSEGLLLLTDDGELTQRLTHPSYQIEKEYRALLDRAPDPEAIREWRSGVVLEGEPTAPAWVDLVERRDEGAWVRVVLHEGRKRQIREVAKLLGYEVLRLIRVREGPLLLGDLPPGAWRQLTDDEVETLWSHVGGRDAEMPTEDAPPARKRRTTEERAPRADARRTTRSSAPSGEADRTYTEGQMDDEVEPRRPNREADSRPGPRRDEDRDSDRGPRRDDRPSYSDRGPRRDDRPYEARGPRRDDRPSYSDRGPRRDDRSYSDRGPRRDDRPYEARGPRRDDERGTGNSDYNRERSRDDRRESDSRDERPERGNERPPARDPREEKRGPGREWEARTEQERAEARKRPAARGPRPQFGERGMRRTGFPFRPRPRKEDESGS